MNSGQAWLMPFESMDEVFGGMPVTHERRRRRVPVGEGVLGRILDGLGRPIDGPLPLADVGWQLAVRQSPSAFQRARIRDPFVTSQKAIDGFLTCGRGQRMGIFAGPGVGKSVLLGQIARNASADINVVALIGERGVELRPFVEDCLGREGLARSVVVLSTSDNLPLMRARAVETAVTIAHAFRQQGANVLFLLDSLTRLAMAQRELGLQLGEPPSSRGFPPSAFQLMADTLELLGNDSRGSITAFATVLVEGDDLDEPISDTARALLDGHIVLSRSLAERGHFPAIDIAQSVSRHFNTVASAEQRMAVRKLTGMLAVYTEVEDLIRIGAYVAGSDARVDKAVELLPLLNAFLQQDLDVSHTLESTCATLVDLASQWPH
jgi:flagellum-specific ATP synthase